MTQQAVLVVSLALLFPSFAWAQGVAASCNSIPSAARAPGQISIPSISLDLRGASTEFSSMTLRAIGGLFNQSDALVSVPAPRVYTGASAEQVARMMQTRILEAGAFRSAFDISPAALDGARWAGLYSDGDVDLLVVAEPADNWPPRGVSLSAPDVAFVSQWLGRDAVFVTTYAGTGVVRAVCDGRAASVVRFLPSPSTLVQATGPRGCVIARATPDAIETQSPAVPRPDLNLSGLVTRWPRPIETALLAPVQSKASHVVLAAFAGYDASPAEVARRYARRLTELPGWHSVYPADIRPMRGGGQAGVFSNGKLDVLLLAYPGADFPGDAVPLTAENRSSLRAFTMSRGQSFGTVAIRFEGRGLADAVCAGQLDAVFKPE